MELPSLLILVSFFILLEAFFSGAEIALISSNWIKIQNQANKGDKAAQAVTKLLRSPDRLFTTTSLGTNLAVVSSASLVTAYMVERFGNRGDLWATLNFISYHFTIRRNYSKGGLPKCRRCFHFSLCPPLKVLLQSIFSCSLVFYFLF